MCMYVLVICRTRKAWEHDGWIFANNGVDPEAGLPYLIQPLRSEDHRSRRASPGVTLGSSNASRPARPSAARLGACPPGDTRSSGRTGFAARREAVPRQQLKTTCVISATATLMGRFLSVQPIIRLNPVRVEVESKMECPWAFGKHNCESITILRQFKKCIVQSRIIQEEYVRRSD